MKLLERFYPTQRRAIQLSGLGRAARFRLFVRAARAVLWTRGIIKWGKRLAASNRTSRRRLRASISSSAVADTVTSVDT